MNCRNCGGPLSWTPGASVRECGFCGSYQPLELAQDVADRVAWLGTTSERPCPKCDQPLEQIALDKTPAEACSQCHGLLVPGEAFAAVVRDRRATYRGAEVMPTPLDTEQLSGGVDCPDCGHSMDRHCYGGPGNQIIDSCGACGLVWLDSGELSAIETAVGRR